MVRTTFRNLKIGAEFFESNHLRQCIVGFRYRKESDDLYVVATGKYAGEALKPSSDPWTVYEIVEEYASP